MTECRWPLVAAAVVVALLIAGAALAAGRASAPDAPAASDDENAIVQSAVRTIDDVPLGIQRSRAGALAAADNYVARVTETIVQDPGAYARLVRAVWVAPGQEGALREGEATRQRSPAAARTTLRGVEGWRLSPLGVSTRTTVLEPRSPPGRRASTGVHSSVPASGGS